MASKLDAVGEEAIFARVAAADPMARIADDLGVDRTTLWRWIRSGGDTRMAAYRAAQVQAADIFAEEAVTILDEAVGCENSHQATVAKARSDVRKWLAERINRDVYGEKAAGLNLTIDIPQLHLDALRTRGSMTLHPTTATLALPPATDDVPAPTTDEGE